MRRLFLTAGLLTGCVANQSPTADEEDAQLVDGGAFDGGLDTGARSPDTAAQPSPSEQCESAISGDAPFGLMVRGLPGGLVPDGARSPWDSIIEPSEFTAQLLFPRGRVPGAPVLMAVGGRGGQLDVGASAILDNKLAAALGVSLQWTCGDNFEGKLVGPSGGLSGAVTYFESDTDASPKSFAYSATLCPAGDLPKAELVAAEPLPTRPFVFYPSVPIDPSTLGAAKLDGAPVELKLETSQALGATFTGGYAIAPASAAFSFADMALDVSGVRDVLGRSFVVGDKNDPNRVLTSVRVMRPSGVVTDLRFDTPLPTAATVGADTFGVEQGKLVSLDYPRLRAVLGLPTQLSAGTLRVTHGVEAEGGPDLHTHITLVSSDGVATPIPVGALVQNVTVSLAGKAPHYLVLEQRFPTNYPCYSPGLYREHYELDELELSP